MDWTNRDWKQFSSQDWEELRKLGITNGCWGKWKYDWITNAIISWLLSKLKAVFIEADCDIHDFTYWQGWDEQRRKECDIGFFGAIMRDIGIGEYWVAKSLKYTALALAFYYAVRLWGSRFFVYTR